MFQQHSFKVASTGDTWTAKENSIVNPSKQPKQPSWLRALEIITGIFVLLFGTSVLVFPNLKVIILVVLLSIGLIFVGFRCIALIALGNFPFIIRMLSTLAGIVSLALAYFVVLNQSYGLLTLIFLLAFGLLAYGISRIAIAYSHNKTVSWIRGMLAAVGVFDVILSILVLLFPGLALQTLAIILSVILLVSGVEIVISGAVGRTWLGEISKVAMEETSANQA